MESLEGTLWMGLLDMGGDSLSSVDRLKSPLRRGVSGWGLSGGDALEGTLTELGEDSF